MWNKMKDLWNSSVFVKIGTIILALVLIVIMLGMARGSSRTSPTALSTVDTADPDSSSSSAGVNGGTDKQLADMQKDLEQEYGKPPDGFIWDQQGHPISLGIASMTSEDVVYTYLRSLSTLDLSMAQKLNRGSTVLQTYQDYFNSTGTGAANSTYDAEFQRNCFKQGMLSLQTNGIQDSAVFAGNKRSYTVNGVLIDFTNKDFWQKDKDKLFTDIYAIDENQNDSTKAEQYIDNYIIQSYADPNIAPLKKVSYNITVEKYPDLNTGWLVSIDTDLNNQLTNAKGVQLNSYIMSQYNQWKKEKQQK